MGKAATYIDWNDAYKWTDQLIKERRIRDAALLFIGTHVALRWGDLSKLTWGQVLQKQFTVTESKRKRERTITFADESMEIIQTLFEHSRIIHNSRKSDHIFINRSGKIFSNKYANDCLKAIADKFGAAYEVSTHSMRKALPRYMYDCDPSYHTIIQLQALLGHKSPFDTIIYLGIRQTEISNMYEKAVRPI